jgi:5-formyltetrahydrofolate cyclo-ligase
MVLTGSCPWPEPWFRTHGAHLHLQAREDPIPTAEAVPPALPMNLLLEKQEMRSRERQRRGELARALPDFGRRIAAHIDELPITPDARVSGYRALAEEADPSGLVSALQANGCEICYPRVHMKGQPLWFHVPVANEPWVPGAFGIPEPRADWPRAFPSVLLVPLLAFDARGHRLGYGGGYYDRTLAQFRHERTVMAIGVAFGGQEVSSVPHDSSDETLDMVITEAGVRRFREQ